MTNSKHYLSDVVNDVKVFAFDFFNIYSEII